MFAWAPIPEPYRELGSIEFAKLMVTDCDVAVSPGVGFGPGGDGHVRFALIENEQRIVQATRSVIGGSLHGLRRSPRRPERRGHARRASRSGGRRRRGGHARA